MIRLYYLTHSLAQAKRVTDDMHAEGISNWHVHIICKDQNSLTHHHLNEANLLEERDIIHSGEQGALIGGTSGLLVSTVAGALELLPFTFALPQVALLTIFCSLFGAWSGGLAGMAKQNYRLTPFKHPLDQGGCLIMVDLYPFQVHKVKQHVFRHYPDLLLAGSSSSITNPFSNRVPLHPA
ncbi:DUF1269 domain-containing protein [Elysia marginata]|uniref:DUF1269 domain-containing protein n=1 Tax=Elysia marginata TaxID=1093978 RepID=A0AAV4FNX7_9GAST|nr:DUF1269 domain-containing protein [Elysia marginata]